jgi:predicted enzyme related to lactoylglutathione lyase
MVRAVGFYRDLLGLSVLDQNSYFTALDLGGVRLGLHWTGGPSVPPIPRDQHGAHAGATVTLKVDDVRAEVDRLSRSGVQFLAPVADHPWGSLAVFVDPDGNVLKLMQPPR